MWIYLGDPESVLYCFRDTMTLTLNCGLGSRKIMSITYLLYYLSKEGAQWLDGRVLDSRPRGRGFEPHRRHCLEVLEQDTIILA